MMFEKFKSLFKKSKTDSSQVYFIATPFRYGIRFTCSELDLCQAGNASSIAQNQYIMLRMIAEEGLATEYTDRFEILKEDFYKINLNEDDEDNYDIRDVFELPPIWDGKFIIEFDGRTTNQSFCMTLILILPDGVKETNYERNGVYLNVHGKTYLPSFSQNIVFDAIEEHSALEPKDKTENRNLLAVYSLKKAATFSDVIIDLAHFEEREIIVPDSIGYYADQKENGDLQLIPCPNLIDIDNKRHSLIEPEDISSRIHQIKSGNSIRSGRKYIVLNDKKISAINEILDNNTIPASQVKDFLKTPSAFLNADIVDIEQGYSIRVLGATVFEPAYFGSSNGVKTDWTGVEGLSNPPALPLVDAQYVIKTEDQEEEFKVNLLKARREKSLFVSTKKQNFILGNPENDSKVIELVHQAVLLNKSGLKQNEKDIIEQEHKEQATIDIVKQDDENEFECYLNSATPYRYEGELVLKNCNVKPYSYQEDGIRWLLGIATNNGKFTHTNEIVGGVLADDMGLGKTFMSLIAMTEYNRLLQERGKIQKPCLVVAPLSLLENWQNEVSKFFSFCPFEDIIILQGKGLRLFKDKTGNESHQLKGDISSGLNALRYVLKVGSIHGNKRLDIPNRLILTTYQTLRDYQFSMCKIDWGFVVFDEAQNIKNPNSLQTRAAKGLKADVMIPATGTPVENSLSDFWCLFDTACPGLLQNYQSFKEKYMKPISQAIGESDEDEVKSYIGKILYNDVGSLLLRRTKEEELEGIPNKNLFDCRCEMNGVQLKCYESILSSANFRPDDDTRGNLALKALHQLRNVSLHHCLVDGKMPIPPENRENNRKQYEVSAKLSLLLELLDQICTRGEKVIIFCIRKQLQAYLAASLPKIYGFPVYTINGDTKTTGNITRIDIINKFQNKDGFNIIIMSPVAAGVGLTVTGANNVIHLERHWNPAKEAQATDRVYRIGQEKDVNVYFPIATHPSMPSFDENLDALLKRKIGLKDAIISHSEVSPRDFITHDTLPNYKCSDDNVLTVNKVNEMSPKTFEALSTLIIAKEFSGKAYLTQQKDHGADGVILCHNQAFLVQAKHRNSHTLTGSSPASDLYRAKPIYSKYINVPITKLFLITNTVRVSDEVIKRVNDYSLEMPSTEILYYTRTRIMQLIEKHQISKIEVDKLLTEENFNL